jgi:omega-hydroxy-beta-dihydromenaquinone-9 sulfotransferase
LTRKRVIFLFLFYTFWPAMLIVTWTCFLIDDVIFPGYKKQPVEKPLFILGNFRTGSTFLHRLLWRDASTFTTLRICDIFLMPSIIQRRLFQGLGRIDAWVGAPFARILQWFDKKFFAPFPIHPISLFKPEEDETILMFAWSSLFVGFLFPFLNELPPYQFFDTAIPKADRHRIMGFYRACVQRHLYASGGGRYFISKNPAFTPKIESLLEFFPDARIVYLVRHPLDMLPSTLSWLSFAWQVCSDPREKYPYRDQVVALVHYWFEHPLAVIDKHESPNHWILDFDELTRCPDLVLGDLYSRFGYPRSPELEQILRDALAQSRMHRSEHTYQLEEMGFTREEIVREFAGIFSRFGFDTREEARIPVTESDAIGEQDSEPSLPKEPEYR